VLKTKDVLGQMIFIPLYFVPAFGLISGRLVARNSLDVLHHHP
jgi:hypothetical protein